MLKTILTLFLAASGCNKLKAATLSALSPVGPHYPILTFEKNENPQNIMVIYTKLDSDCHFRTDPDDVEKPIFDFYWLMDRKNYKPVHSLIKSGVHSRLQLKTDEAFKDNHQAFDILINDLKELKTDLKEARVHVTTIRSLSKSGTTAKCEVKATMPLGPSEKNRLLELKTIYSEAEKTIIPPFRRVTSVTLIGTSANDGQEIKKTFSKP